VSTALTGLFAALATAIVAAMVTIYTSARKLSGQVATTDADRLWDAGEVLRKETREALDATRHELDIAATRLRDVESRMAETERHCNELERENIRLHASVAESERIIIDLRAQLGLADRRRGTDVRNAT
jgi:predicted RNase H-like nuclease (RuvC/YqgF family)